MSFYKLFKTNFAAAVLFAPLTGGCATAGLLYEDVGHPPIHVSGTPDSGGIGWDSNLNASTGGRALTKKGVACSQDILKLFAWGDATQAAAAKQGGITEVVGVDFDNTAILGLIYTRNCTVVYGKVAAANVAGTPASAVVSPVAVDAPAAPPKQAEAPAVAAPAEGPTSPPAEITNEPPTSD